MERVFTRQIGRFELGAVRDYAKSVWQQIERSAKQPLEKFSRPVDEALRDSAGARKAGDPVGSRR